MSETYDLDLWVREIHRDNITALSFKVEETLFSGRSQYQKVDVLKTKSHGNILINDGVFMLSELDEFVYHEMISHVPLFTHPSPKSVLIVGGGDGGTAREVLRHPVEKVVMVEIDELVVNVSRKYLPGVSCALDDPRLELIIDDGVKYVAQTKETFDVVIVDSTDPMPEGPSVPLFDKPFYEKAASVLGPDGILITQAESPFYDQDIQKTMLSNQRSFFGKLHIYLYTTVSYPGGLWSFSFASKGLCPVADFDSARVEKLGLPIRYYNPAVHRAAFALPNFASEGLGELLDPIPQTCSQ